MVNAKQWWKIQNQNLKCHWIDCTRWYDLEAEEIKFTKQRDKSIQMFLENI